MISENSKKEVLDFLKMRMLNTREAAMYLGLSVITVRRKAGNGEISSYRPNKKNLYFKISDLDNYFSWVTPAQLATCDWATK